LNRRRAKLLSIAFCTILFALIFFDYSPALETVHAFPTGPDPGRTAAPGELSCATSECHGTSRNTGPGKFTIVAPDRYEPGQTYQITVRNETTDTTRTRWGFQLTALTETNTKAGTLQNINGFTSVVRNAGPNRSRDYIQHNITGTFQGQTTRTSWIFNWVAPDQDAGEITFYAAGNQANNDGTSSGDQIYTTKVTIKPAHVMPLPVMPEITGAEVKGKNLIITGEGFIAGAQLFINGKRHKKTINDAASPSIRLIAKKAAKTIAPQQTVLLKVKNPDGTESEEFEFARQ
jgi:hypothetical protein